MKLAYILSYLRMSFKHRLVLRTVLNASYQRSTDHSNQTMVYSPPHMKEREFVGQGREHRVVRSRRDTQTVLKTPRVLNSLALRYLFDGVRTVRRDIDQKTRLAKRAGVQIPTTRVFSLPSFQGSYVIAQKYIPNDHSVHIGEYLKSRQVDELTLMYESHSDNFLSYRGRVYLVDLTHEFFIRLVQKTKVMNTETCWKTKVRFKRAILDKVAYLLKKI